MSQQIQPAQQGYQMQTPTGQQLQASPFGQAIGQRFDESVPQEVQRAVMDLDRLETVVEWAKSRAVEGGTPRVAQRCDDLAEIAHLEKHLLLRGSPFAQPIGQATMQTIQQGVQELQAHASQPEVREAVSQAQQSAGSIESALGRLPTGGQGYGRPQPAGAAQPPGQQPGQFQATGAPQQLAQEPVQSQVTGAPQQQGQQPVQFR